MSILIVVTASLYTFYTNGVAQVYLYSSNKVSAFPLPEREKAPSDLSVAFLTASNSSISFSCSSFFIKEDLLLTAAHCLASSPSDVRVFPGALGKENSVFYPVGACQAVSWKVDPRYVYPTGKAHQKSFKFDYALVKVEKSCLRGTKVVPFVLEPFEDAKSTNVLMSNSYPSSEAFATPIYQKGTLLTCLLCSSDHVVASNIKAVEGSSGGVIWVEEDGLRKAVAITVGLGKSSSIHRVVDEDLVEFVRENS